MTNANHHLTPTSTRVAHNDQKNESCKQLQYFSSCAEAEFDCKTDPISIPEKGRAGTRISERWHFVRRSSPPLRCYLLMFAHHQPTNRFYVRRDRARIALLHHRPYRAKRWARGGNCPNSPKWKQKKTEEQNDQFNAAKTNKFWTTHDYENVSNFVYYTKRSAAVLLVVAVADFAFFFSSFTIWLLLRDVDVCAPLVSDDAIKSADIIVCSTCVFQ